MVDQFGANAEVLHHLELVRRDLAQLSTRVGELVSTERYTLEHGMLLKELERLDSRVTEMERKRETQKHLMLSSFLFPLLIAFITYIMLSGA